MKMMSSIVIALLVMSECTGFQSSDNNEKSVSQSFVYAVSSNEKALKVVSFDSVRGTLTTLQTLPIGNAAASVVYSPKHNSVYVAGGGKSAKPHGKIFSVAKDGRLTFKTDFSWAHGYCYLKTDRTGDFLFGASYGSGHADAYRLDDEGLPVLTSTVFHGKNKAHGIATTANNRFAYVPFVKDSNALYQYSFDEKTGELNELNPPTAEVGSTAGPRHMAFHPTKPFVYFSNEQHLGVSSYAIGDDGKLELIQIVENGIVNLMEGVDASSITITPDGKFVFAAIRGFSDTTKDLLVCYNVQGDGTLVVAGSTSTDHIPWIIDMSPDGKHVLVSASKGGTLTAYRIAVSGVLTKTAQVELGKGYRDMSIN